MLWVKMQPQGPSPACGCWSSGEGGGRGSRRLAFALSSSVPADPATCFTRKSQKPCDATSIIGDSTASPDTRTHTRTPAHPHARHLCACAHARTYVHAHAPAHAHVPPHARTFPAGSLCQSDRPCWTRVPWWGTEGHHRQKKGLLHF